MCTSLFINSLNNKLTVSDVAGYNKSINNNHNLTLFNNTTGKMTVNKMKRDTKSVLIDTEVVKVNKNTTYTADEIQNNIFTPLNSIINDNQKELEKLLRIRENFISYIKTYHSDDFEIDYVSDFPYDNTTTQLSVYKLKIEPELKTIDDLKSIDPNIINKYFDKIKRDIYEVFKDIVDLQNFDANKMPDKFKILVQSMKLYVGNNGNFNDRDNTAEALCKSSRKCLDKRKSNITKNPSIEGILNILKILNKNMSSSNALAPLSFKAKKLIKRVIKNNYIDDLSVIGLKVSDSNYNLTNDLANIGNHWQKLTDDIAKSNIFNRLFAIKHLHYQLAIDIRKITDALNTVTFAHSRRVENIKHVGDNNIEKISQGLHFISAKMKYIIKLHQQKKNEHLINLDTRLKKESFFKRLKLILRNSKNEISKLFKGRVSKTGIVKKIAANKLEDLQNEETLQFKETMTKWQEKLNLIPK